MKTIKVQTIINSIRSRKDGSLGFSAETPELTVEEKVAFMQLQNQILETTFKPEGVKQDKLTEIKTEVRQKTQAQRLRGVLYKVWETRGEGTFEDFYLKQTEKIIERYKAYLE